MIFNLYNVKIKLNTLNLSFVTSLYLDTSIFSNKINMLIVIKKIAYLI